MTARQYPLLPVNDSRPTRPISFVVVHYSDDYVHNVLQSEAVHDPVNQLITVDNRQNLFYDNLTQAINAGLSRAVHEIVAVVHEDVLLPRGWQVRLEQSLADLEREDPAWGLLGSAGWTAEGVSEGHFSDPGGYRNTLTERAYTPVARIDEQLMILRRSAALRLDECLPSIHLIGADLPETLRRRGLCTYVVDAPTIHKFADESGTPIVRREDSPKIQARQFPPFLADWACSEEYLHGKWPEWRPPQWDIPHANGFRPDVWARLPAPVVLVARGGSGSRLLSSLATDAGVFIGTDLNVSGDAMEMAQDLYMAVLNRYHHRAEWQRSRIVPRIRGAAARMLERAGPSHRTWGFKLPEVTLLMPELRQAFEHARYVHLIRDPLSTCLRRTHMTARFDNVIGRVAIREAYRYCGRPVRQSVSDSPALKMAYTTVHQVESVRSFARDYLADRYLEIRFEDLLQQPGEMVSRVAAWLGTQALGTRLAQEIDPERARCPSPEHCYPADVQSAVAEVLAPLRRELGYL